MRTILTILFILTALGSIGIFRRMAMGVEIDIMYLIASILITIVLGIWLFILKKKAST